MQFTRFKTYILYYIYICPGCLTWEVTELIRLTWYAGSTQDCTGTRERCVGSLLPGRNPFALGRGMRDAFRSGRAVAVISDRWVTMRVQR